MFRPSLRATQIALGCVLAVLALSARPRPASSDDLPPLRGDRAPEFTADIAISVDASGHPGLGVTVTVPYADLQWVKVPAGYAAGAEFTVSLEPHAPGRLYGDVWSRQVVMATLERTQAAGPGLSERRTFAVPPGRYRARIMVRDVNSEESSSATEEVEVPDYSRMPLGIADMELGVSDSTRGFQAIPGRRFGLEVSHLVAKLALFDHRPGNWPRSYPLRYRILDDTNQEVASGLQTVVVAQPSDSAIVRPTRSDLFVGDYVFEVELAEGRSHWRVDRSFQVEASGPPRGKEFERLLEPLSYIALPGEIDHLRSLPPDQQAQGWDEFWKRRDPTPDTPRNEALIEFFRRLRYAEQHFQGFGPGWRSDMGRIYIKYGAPDQVEQRPATTGSAQMEIWYYNQPYRRFVFVDQDGFGRFSLVSPSLE